MEPKNETQQIILNKINQSKEIRFQHFILLKT